GSMYGEIITFTQPSCGTNTPTATPMSTSTSTRTITPTSTSTSTSTRTITPTITPTGTPTPTPCGASSDYTFVTATATIVPASDNTGNNCGDCTTNIALPFPVAFYDNTFNSANVSSNGNLQFISNQIGGS